jgi:ketosteroid isomerase-like protein
MKKLSLIFLIVAIFSVSALAQKADDSKDALAVVNKMFAEMAAHNPAGIVALYTPEAQLTAAFKNKEGKSAIKTFPVEAFSKNFAEKKNELKEEMYAPEVKVFGDLALVWGRYVFFIDGKIYHCGVNAFHLVRTDAGWKVANASTTIEPQGCTEQEKAMKTIVPPKQS